MANQTRYAVFKRELYGQQKLEDFATPEEAEAYRYKQSNYAKACNDTTLIGYEVRPVEEKQP